MKVFTFLTLVLATSIFLPCLTNCDETKIKDVKKWGKEDIDLWLAKIHLTILIKPFEKHGIGNGIKLLYIDEEFIDANFPILSKLEKKVLLGELSSLLSNTFENTPKGLWIAFEQNPGKTLFTATMFVFSPRMTYLMMYYYDPELLSLIMKTNYTNFSFGMILIPEIVVAINFISNYVYDHPLITIVFCLFNVLNLAFYAKSLINEQVPVSHMIDRIGPIVWSILPIFVPQSFSIILVYAQIVLQTVFSFIFTAALGADGNANNNKKYR